MDMAGFRSSQDRRILKSSSNGEPFSRTTKEEKGTADKVNKSDFAKELAALANIPRARALEITDTMLGILSDTLNKGEAIQFIGFGTFDVRHTPERMARNPKTLEPVLIPERYKAVFKPSPHLMDSMNGK